MTVANNANTYLSPVIQIPSALTITAISNSNPMVLTTTSNTDQSNTYIPGQSVVLNVPVTYGMWQANGLIANITAISGSNITLNIDSTLFDPFVVPVPNINVATLAPNGSRNLPYNNGTNQLGFQSLNNTGN